MAMPHRKEIRQWLLPLSARTTAYPIVLLAFDYALLLAALTGAVLLDAWWLRLLCGMAAGFVTGRLFIVGHDACHQSLTPRRWLNKWIGRLTMVPTWHAYSVWDLGHNGLHHGWTNVRGKDFTWTPLSKEDYDRLTPVGRFMQRKYRTWWGVGFYYIVEIWAKYGMLGAKAPTRRMGVLFWIDRLSIVGHTVALTAAILFLTDRTGLGANPGGPLVTAGLLTLGIVIPYILWHWVMGFIVLVHHTHPTVPWYGDVADWSYYAGQVQSTVHVELPRPVEVALHHIMEHTAHHADPRVPLYHLEKAQKALEDAYGDDIVVVPFTVAGFFKTLRTCRLFDYENHRWLDWDGTPTTGALLAKREDGQVVQSRAA